MTSDEQVQADRLSRARGCLMGQLAGDALGGQVEFMDSDAIRIAHPDGVRTLANGGRWNTLAGQPTDDSEMALMLARSLVKSGTYDRDVAAQNYLHWYGSGPFDIGNTILQALDALIRWRKRQRDIGGNDVMPQRTTLSQANGALMRISPLGILGHEMACQTLAAWARADADITHPNPVCLDANAVYVVAIAHAIQTGATSEDVYAFTLRWGREASIHEDVLRDLEKASVRPPDDYESQMGWVRIAFQNAFYRMLNSRTLESGVVDTVMRGGDTDTNAAIAGALLGAVHGIDAVPEQWRTAVLSCRPERGRPGVLRPRPAEFWPVDAMQLADELLSRGSNLSLSEATGERS